MAEDYKHIYYYDIDNSTVVMTEIIPIEGGDITIKGYTGTSSEGNTRTCYINGGEGDYSGETSKTSEYSTFYTITQWHNTKREFTVGEIVNFSGSLNNYLYYTYYNTSEGTTTGFYWPEESKFTHSDSVENFTITGDGNGGQEKTLSATKTISYYKSSRLYSSIGNWYNYGSFGYLSEDEENMEVYPLWWEDDPVYTNNTIRSLGSTSRDSTQKVGYVITFDSLSDTISQSVDYSYIFKGWYNSSSGGTKYDDSASFTEETTVYAQWDETKKPNAVQQFPTPTKPGYEFLGWMKQDGTILTGDDFANMLPSYESEPLTLYASWKAKGLARIYVDGGYKQALCYVYHEGQYYQAMPYIYTNGEYRLGG